MSLQFLCSGLFGVSAAHGEGSAAAEVLDHPGRALAAPGVDSATTIRLTGFLRAAWPRATMPTTIVYPESAE
jgi:hypothetical protein